MKITINTEMLKREHLTMGEFLVMLIGYYDVGRTYFGCDEEVLTVLLYFKALFIENL